MLINIVLDDLLEFCGFKSFCVWVPFNWNEYIPIVIQGGGNSSLVDPKVIDAVK